MRITNGSIAFRHRKRRKRGENFPAIPGRPISVRHRLLRRPQTNHHKHAFTVVAHNTGSSEKWEGKFLRAALFSTDGITRPDRMFQAVRQLIILAGLYRFGAQTFIQSNFPGGRLERSYVPVFNRERHIVRTGPAGF